MVRPVLTDAERAAKTATRFHRRTAALRKAMREDVALLRKILAAKASDARRTPDEL